MTETISFPPLRELPPGRLEARKRHLLREIAAEPDQRRSWRGVLVAAVALAALAGAGVAIAAGFGVFNGLSRTQHPRTAADVLPGKTRVGVVELNAALAKTWRRFHKKPPLILPATARLLGRLPLPRTGNVYAATDTTGNLCIIFESGWAQCTLPLSRSNPVITDESKWWGDGIWGPVGLGVAIDGVTSVSFKSRGQEVTVPVEDNLWYYLGPNTAGHALTLHHADGTTEIIRNDCNGECGSERPVDPDAGDPVGLH